MMLSLSKMLFGGRRHSAAERLLNTKLIACDLDGTLLNRDEIIGTATVLLIRKIESLGIPFILITRRHHQAVEPYAEQLRMSQPIISLDGGITRLLHSESTLATIEFDQEFALDIIDEVIQTTGAECSVITPDRFLFSRPDILLPSYYLHWNIETEVAADFDNVKGSILEIVVAGGYYPINTILNYVESKMGEGELKLRMYESHTHSDLWYLEVRSAQATKQIALERLLPRYGATMDQVIGIGDHYNDLEFCERSGYVVAVKNAVRELREMADFITSHASDDEGVNEFLEYFLKAHGVDPREAPEPQREPEGRRKRSR
ncbi:MAG: HAD hydrolase family protein [Candidatus Kapaibacterium sp.]